MGVEQSIGLPEFREIPNGFFTVIADDEPDKAAKTNDAIQSGFASGDKTHGEIQIAKNVMDLLSAALYGKDGKQADVVLLDDTYRENLQDWLPKDEDLMALAARANVDFSPYLIKDHDYDNIPFKLYLPSSIHFAILLRIFGFSNNIFVVSSGSPDAEQIATEVEALGEFTKQYKKVFPINGYTLKGPLLRNQMYYSNTLDNRGHWEPERVTGGLAQSLQRLFTSQPAVEKAVTPF